MDAFLYYYNESGAPTLLHSCLRRCLKIFDHVYLVTSDNVRQSILANELLEKNKIFISCVDMNKIYSHRLIQAYIDSINKGNIRSNCPPIEIHCIYRWIAMSQIFQRLDDCEGQLMMLDWDTLVFNLPPTDLCSYSLVYADSNDRDRLPLWHVCPHFMLLKKPVLDLYLDIFIPVMRRIESMSQNYFCDMDPWSHVLSRIYHGSSHLNCISWQELCTGTNLVYEGNMRLGHDLSNYFLTTSFNIPFDHPANFTGTASINLKSIFRLPGGSPDIFLAMYNEISSMGELVSEQDSSVFTLRKPLCLHYSGTEAKYILMTHQKWLLEY